jgi:hypothetical protein
MPIQNTTVTVSSPVTPRSAKSGTSANVSDRILLFSSSSRGSTATSTTGTTRAAAIARRVLGAGRASQTTSASSRSGAA